MNTATMLQRDQLWSSWTRRRQRDAVGPRDMRRRRVAFDDGILPVCLFVLSGLVLLGGLVLLLSWITVTVPVRQLKSCSDAERCVAPAVDANESVGADDPLADRLTITR